MKIGVMGLGTIAQKAYIPVMNELRHEVTWHYYSRNQLKVTELAQKHGWTQTFNDLEKFYASGIEACFVHTPTNTHGELIRELLNRGIHVFVDKPVSEDYQEVAELHQLASSKGLLLMTGFNRRFAPLNQELKTVSDKKLIIAQKNRKEAKALVKFEIFDMLIHVVDSVLYLLDDPIVRTDYKVKALANGYLSRAMIIFETTTTTGIASINMEAGAHTETIEVQALSGTYSVADLAVLQQNRQGIVTQKTFGDWENTLVKRGFSQMIQAFITALNDQQESAIATAQSSLVSHYYIEELYQVYLNQRAQSNT